MKTLGLSFILFVIYVITMLGPNLSIDYNYMDAKNPMFLLYFGVIHIPSLIYILGSAIFLHFAVSDKVQNKDEQLKKVREEVDEAEKMLNTSSIDYETIKNTQNSFVQSIRDLVISGGMDVDIELLLEKKLLQLKSQYEKLILEYGYIAAVLPMLGMLGTITGLLQMFAVSDGIDNIAQKMVGLSVALATTLYATLIVVLHTKPKARVQQNELLELEQLQIDLTIQAKMFLHMIPDITQLQAIYIQEESEPEIQEVQEENTEDAK